MVGNLGNFCSQWKKREGGQVCDQRWNTVCLVIKSAQIRETAETKEKKDTQEVWEDAGKIKELLQKRNKRL